jgi:hypothetical protein
MSKHVSKKYNIEKITKVVSEEDKEKYLNEYLSLATHYKSKEIFENLLETVLNHNGG